MQETTQITEAQQKIIADFVAECKRIDQHNRDLIAQAAAKFHREVRIRIIRFGPSLKRHMIAYDCAIAGANKHKVFLNGEMVTFDFSIFPHISSDILTIDQNSHYSCLCRVASLYIDGGVDFHYPHPADAEAVNEHFKALIKSPDRPTEPDGVRYSFWQRLIDKALGLPVEADVDLPF